MLVDIEILPFLKKAEQGCPKCQYIMADHYMYGKGVPKSREKSKHYYGLLAKHDPSELTFLNACFGTLLLLIGYLHYTDHEDREAAKYFNLAKSYFRKSLSAEEAEQKIQSSNIEKYLASIR
jgi:TPR repeat protein